MKPRVIVIKLAGRSPRLVRRWCEQGLLPGFAMLAYQASPQSLGGQYSFDDLEHDAAPNCQLTELWANELGCGSKTAFDVGVRTDLPDSGVERVIDALPQHHSVQELVGSLRDAGMSVIEIARALVSCRPSVFDHKPTDSRMSHDWLRWQIFKSRWLTSQPAIALLNLPCPDRASGHQPFVATGAMSPLRPFCPERQVDYAQSLMASYLMVDEILQQAVRLAKKRNAGLIVSVGSHARIPRVQYQQGEQIKQSA